jgi:hypothetical protein
MGPAFGLSAVLNPLTKYFSILLLAGAALSLARPAAAEPVQTVLELFTSQGCSSCPPADRLAEQLAGDRQRLVLSLPVDYWDYLGWKDTLAHSAFTARQKNYAVSRGDRQVYTPQMVINGMHHVVGSDQEGIEAGSAAAGPLPYQANIEKTGGNYLVVLPATPDRVDASVLVLAVLHARTVKIGRGENGGSSVTYVNIVRGISDIGQWRGAAVRLVVPASAIAGEAGDADSFVVLVQHKDRHAQGAILAAAKAPGF